MIQPREMVKTIPEKNSNQNLPCKSEVSPTHYHSSKHLFPIFSHCFFRTEASTNWRYWRREICSFSITKSPKYPPLHLPKVGSFTRTTSFFNLPSLVQVVAFLPHWKSKQSLYLSWFFLVSCLQLISIFFCFVLFCRGLELRNVCSHWCWIFTCCSLSYYYSISRKGQFFFFLFSTLVLCVRWQGLGYVFRRNPLHCLCVGLDHNDNEESERIISSFDETKGLFIWTYSLLR